MIVPSFCKCPLTGEARAVSHAFCRGGCARPSLGKKGIQQPDKVSAEELEGQKEMRQGQKMQLGRSEGVAINQPNLPACGFATDCKCR